MKLDRLFGHAGSLLIVGLLAGCGGEDTTEPQAVILSLISGSNQTANEGQAVADPLVVQVTQGGNGVAGTTVSWSVTDGGGSVNPTSSATDNAGMASTEWTLGATEGDNGVQASVSGATGSPVAFTATGLGPPPMQAAVSVEDNSFNPTSQRVAVGGAVTWTWAGNNQHTVTFTSGTNSVQKNAGTFMRDFPAAGSFAYLCLVHGASMSGTIVVE